MAPPDRFVNVRIVLGRYFPNAVLITVMDDLGKQFGSDRLERNRKREKQKHEY